MHGPGPKNERVGTTWEEKGLYPWIIDSLSKVYSKVKWQGDSQAFKLHQYARQKSTKTSGVHFFFKSSFFPVEN